MATAKGHQGLSPETTMDIPTLDAKFDRLYNHKKNP